MLDDVEQHVFDCAAPAQRFTCAAPAEPDKRFVCHANGAGGYVKISVSVNANGHVPGVAHGSNKPADQAPGASANDLGGSVGLDCDCTPRTCANQCTGAANGTACDDADRCTSDGTCQGGICQPGAASCATGVAVDACNTQNGACDAATGECLTDALQCGEDGNSCTDQSCDPNRGCVATPNTASCDDGSACTIGDTCSDGACAGSSLACVDDGNPCTTELCDPQRGCVRFENGDPCDDGDPSTGFDVCTAGTCAGTPLDTDIACFTDEMLAGFASDDSTQFASGSLTGTNIDTAPGTWQTSSCALDPPQGTSLDGRYCPMFEQLVDRRNLSNVRIEMTLFTGRGLTTHPGIVFRGVDAATYGFLYLRPHSNNSSYAIVLSSATNGFIANGGPHLEGLAGVVTDVGFNRQVDLVVEIVDNRLTLLVNGVVRIQSFGLPPGYASAGMAGLANCDNNDPDMKFLRFKVTAL